MCSILVRVAILTLARSTGLGLSTGVGIYELLSAEPWMEKVGYLLLVATNQYRTARSTIKEEMRVKVFLPSARYTPTYTGNREETVSRLTVTFSEA